MLKKLISLIILLIFLFFLGRALFLNTNVQNHTGEGQTELSFRAFELKSQAMLSIKQWRGSWFLLHFWASWCDNCQLELPILQKYQAILPIIGVRYKDASKPSIWSNLFTAEFADPQGRLGLELGVMATPESFLINPKGQVVYRYQGPLTHAMIKKEILPRLTA